MAAFGTDFAHRRATWSVPRSTNDKKYPAQKAAASPRKGNGALEKVTVEILPGGHAEYRRTIGLMRIPNETDLARRSDHRVDLTEGDNPVAGTKARLHRVGTRS
jgi:hypothetical protein